MHLQRNYSALANRYLKSFPVLCLLGPRQAGKTEFATHLASDWDYFDLELPSNYELITRDPELFFEQYPQNIIIDEAQEYPELFKVLRSVVDNNRQQKGRFILTGSSSPEITAHISDSLAGRVGIIPMSPLKANEYYQQPLSDFYQLFIQSVPKDEINLLPPQLTSQQMRHCWIYGGFPEPLLANDPIFYLDWMNNYYATYINRDISKLFPKLNKNAYQRFIKTLAALSGTVINKAELARAIEINEKTISEYLQIAEQTYLWRNILFDANSTVKSIVKKPKGFLVDSGLQHYLQKITDLDQLIAHPNAGHSFEGFVTEEIIRGLYAHGLPSDCCKYYRTAKGAEVDLIIETPYTTIPIEIKMGKSVSLKQLSSLSKYIADNQLPYGILINQSDRVFWVSENILQIPVGCI